MKNKITYGLFTLTALLFLMYAFVQKAEADKQWKRAKQESQRADSLIMECERQRLILQERVRELTLTEKEQQ